MIDTKLHTDVDAFIESYATNAWLMGTYLHVYLRKNVRWLVADHNPIDREDWSQHRKSCIDLANISDMRIEHQLQGVFPAFLDHLESKRQPVYIENVQFSQLCWYYERRGYTRIEPPMGDTPSFYRLA